ncbi:MAG: serine hydrolase [Phycisphaeraceae bacterium]|nr:serine hydrolase [Phycisphaeraceae bacterium]
MAKWMIIVWLLIVSIAPICPVWSRTALIAPTDLSGRWQGSINIPGSALEVKLSFTSNEAGTISIPAQGAKDLPLEKVLVDGKKATFAIRGVPGNPVFSGTFSDNGESIAGDFTQGGGTIPFELKRSPDAKAASADSLDGLDQFLDKARQDWQVPGLAVAIIKGEEIVYAKGFGFRDVDAKLPVTENTLFPIGSATKAFTTFVMGQLVDDGKLDFDKPVINYLPEFRLYDTVLTERITPRDLVTHRSGLPRHDLLWYGNTPRSREDMVRRLAYLPNNKDLRGAWQYNNLMFLTAGVLEERLTGESWEENIRARILAPLGMKRTTLRNTDSEKDSDYALGYRLNDETDKVERMDFRDITTMGPAGSICSSVTEMSEWVKLNLSDGAVGGKRLIKESTLKDLHAPQMSMGEGSPENPQIIPVGYAMGWFVDVFGGNRRLHHGGNIDGFSAMVAFLPREDVGVVVLTNMNGTGLPETVARHVFDRMTGAKPTDWNALALARRSVALKQAKEAKSKLTDTRKPGTHPSHPITEYAGQYEHAGYGIIEVAVEESSGDASLNFTFNGIATPLEHWHYDVFSGKRNEEDRTFEGFKIQFESGLDGEIDSLRAQMESAEEPFEFKRLGDANLRDIKFLEKLTGDFSIETQPVKFSIAGNVLTATLPGQPVYELEPARHNTFRIKELPGFSIQFLAGENGGFDAAKFVQPNGVFTAKRVPAK